MNVKLELITVTIMLAVRIPKVHLPVFVILDLQAMGSYAQVS